MVKRLLFLLLVAFFLRLPAVRYPFINYRSSDGLPQSNVTAMLQDRDGYIWIGTQSGIGKFDGIRFEIITKRDGLSGNYISDLELARNGDVWVASQEGLSQFHDGKIRVWPLADNFIRDIAFSPVDSTLWVLAADALFTIRDGSASRAGIFADPSRLNGMASTKSGMVFYSPDAVFRLQKGHVVEFASPEKVNFVKETAGHLFVGCRNGLFVLNPFGEFKKYSGLPAAMSDVSDILFDMQKNLWIASRNGVFFKNLQTGDSTIFNTANGLIYDRVSRLLLDRESNIFIGCEFGLSQLSRHLFRMYGIEDGLPSTQIWDMLESGGGILLACDDGIAELRDGAIHAFAVNRRLKNQSIRAIVAMAGGSYLLGCRDGEIFEWDGRERLRSLTAGVNVLYAIRDSGGNAWFATDRGLLKYDGRNFRWFREGLNDPMVWDIAELEKGSLLVGTRRGLQLFRDGKFVPSAWEELVGRRTINDIRVISPREALVALERDGLIWLRGDAMTRLDLEQGLLNNDVWSVLRDDNGYVWMNTTSGLERCDSGGVFTHFNKQTGLFGDEGCVHSALKAANGDLYFGVVPGLVQYSFFKEEAALPKPVLVVLDPLINGTPRRLPLSAPLPYRQNAIEFRYICPSTSREGTTVYRTRLFPFDSDWSAPSRGLSVRYTNLPPGNYAFSVLANTGGGKSEWFGGSQRIRFAIHTPFWKRWWFMALELLLGLAAVLLIVQVRVRVLKAQKKRLEEVVRARTNEIAEKNKELAHLSITDPLTDLKNRRYLDATIKEDMSIIQRERHNVLNDLKPFDDKAAALGVFMIDVDRFKKVNDLHGHEAGDAVIVEIARRLQGIMRQSDTVVRWGGEEFLVITRQSRRSDAFALAERIRLSIEQKDFQVAPGQRIHKTVSIGFCHYPFISGEADKLGWHQVVAMADTALYLAKHNGRNMAVGIEPGTEAFFGPGQELLSDVATAIQNGHLHLISHKNHIKVPVH
jgi:diguanylate cyclase (GGDEF)-like protein